jgi:restriction system-associated AAA family ATPase
MKLLRLKVNSSFGSLNDGFEIEFRSPLEENEGKEELSVFHPFCLVGRNGSGKSNVLEALANIFYHLESCVNIKQPSNFKDYFDPKVSSPDAYELEYYIEPTKSGKTNLVKVEISKKKNEIPEMTYLEYPFIGEPVSVITVSDKYAQISAPAKNYLPDLIIGYSSGENEILSIPFLKTRLLHYDEYEETLRERFEYKEPESSLIYIDYEMSQAVLLSNFLFQSEDVLNPIKTELKINDIKSFRMYFNIHKIEETPVLEGFEPIELFKKCATAIFEKDDKLILDFWINEHTKRAFKSHFENIFKLFRSFQVLYTLNYRVVDRAVKSAVYQSKGYYTHGKIPVPGPKEKVFYFENYLIEKQIKGGEQIVPLLLKNLSDGEQQFLHSLGICLMLDESNVLLLLDEPETHFNPDWRSKFISILQRTLESRGDNNSRKEVLITSHSPFIISDCFPENVIVFQAIDGSVRALSARDLNFNTYGTSVNLITSKIFEKRETIGTYSLNRISEFRKRFYNGEDPEYLKNELNEIVGDSIEKLLFIKEMYEDLKLQ